MSIAANLCRVVENHVIQPGFHRLVLMAPALAQAVVPGQFAMVRCAQRDSSDPLLRRPLSISNAVPATGEVTFLFQVKGRGTRALAKLRTDMEADVLGPLGRGFALPKGPGTIAVIGCGVGVAPLVYLACHAAPLGHTVYTFLAAQNTGTLLAEPALIANSSQVYEATADGSRGLEGNIVHLLQEHLHELGQCDACYVCGPEAAMAAVVPICLAAAGRCQVSLESVMACGVGACLGCTCQRQGQAGYARVCTEGPVFDGQEVILRGKSQSQG